MFVNDEEAQVRKTKCELGCEVSIQINMKNISCKYLKKITVTNNCSTTVGSEVSVINSASKVFCKWVVANHDGAHLEHKKTLVTASITCYAVLRY